MHDEPRHAMTMDNYSFGQPSHLASLPRKPPGNDPSNRQPLLLWLARALPLISALLLLMAVWLPWVTLHVAFDDTIFDSRLSGMEGLSQLIGQARRSLLDIAALLLLSIVVPLFGLLFGLALQRKPRISWTLISIYSVWLLLTTLICLLVFIHALTMPLPFICAPGDPVCPQVRVVSRSVEPGGRLALGSLAMGWLACALLLWSRSHGVDVLPTKAVRYTSPHRVGAGILTLGALLWAFGLYAVPWATAGCTGLHLSLNHFVRGACRGVDGYDVLTAGLGSNSALVWPFLEASLVMGMFVVVTVWLPRLSRPTWVTALGWILLVTLMACIGVFGVRVTMANPPIFAFGEELIWGPSYGVAICALGIVVGGIGTALLARDELRRAR